MSMLPFLEHVEHCAVCRNTEEYKAKLREKMTGANNVNFGKKASSEQRAKLSAAHKGIQAGANNPNYGKTMSPEQKEKIRRTKVLRLGIGARLARLLAGIE